MVSIGKRGDDRGRSRTRLAWTNIIRVGKEVDKAGVDFITSFIKKTGDGMETKLQNTLGG